MCLTVSVRFRLMLMYTAVRFPWLLAPLSRRNVANISCVLSTFSGRFKVTVLLPGPIRVVLLVKFNLCNIVKFRSVNVLPSLTMLKLSIVRFRCLASPCIVGIGLTFTMCGVILVSVTLRIPVWVAKLRPPIVLVDVRTNVVVLLPMFDVPLVAMAPLVLPIGPSPVRAVSAALVCGRLLRAIMALFPPRVTCILMTLLVKNLVVRVVVACRRSCRVKVLRLLCDILQLLVMPLVARGTVLMLHRVPTNGPTKC